MQNSAFKQSPFLIKSKKDAERNGKLKVFSAPNRDQGLHATVWHNRTTQSNTTLAQRDSDGGDLITELVLCVSRLEGSLKAVDHQLKLTV